MSVAHALLGLLTAGERCGYELREELEVEFGPEWRIDFGQLYRVLAKIEGAGWARVKTLPSARGPERKMYRLTRSGRAELRRWIREPEARASRRRDELPLKLRFAMGVKPATSPEPLAEALAERRRRAGVRQQAERTACKELLPKGDVGAWLLADRRRREAETAVAWLDTCQGVLGSKPIHARDEVKAVVFAGSDDLLLDLLASHVGSSSTAVSFDGPRVGSLGGLLALRDGQAQLAGIHLLDTESGDYNVPFVKHLLPEDDIILITLAHREQGIIVAPGNPKQIRSVRDLAKRQVRLINRQPGAGTRLLLFHHLRRNGIDPRTLPGYDREVGTHSALAAAIAGGTADAGPGIRAAANAHGLEFVPLARERYDLAVPKRVFDSPAFRPVLEALHARAFSKIAATTPGYDTTEMGRVVAELR